MKNLLKPTKFVIKIARKMGQMAENRDQFWLDRVGTREMVGYGTTGDPFYVDRNDYPFPSIRWKEVNPEILSLNEKQRGNWKLLTREEKKKLYRASFRQTFEEFQALGGDWAEPIAYALFVCCAGMGLHIFIRLLFLSQSQKLPESFTPSRQRAQLRRQINMRTNPLQGLASEWDYERMDWKVVTWRTPPNPFVEGEDDANE